MSNTNELFSIIQAEAKKEFISQLQRYGTSVLGFRPLGFLSQIQIKIARLKTLQNGATAKVYESEIDTLRAVYNYATMGSILHKNDNQDFETCYRETQAIQEALMQNKNHDYGEAWRAMSVNDITDVIDVKLRRLKHYLQQENDLTIYDNSCYLDVANYAIFAIILLQNK